MDNSSIVDNISVALPEGAEYVIWTLNKNNYEAFLVGGCVRDILLGIEPKDWDIATNALPEDIKIIFKNTADTGLRHGTITVMAHNQAIEVTTFRVEGKYSDHRRPDKVIFTSYLEQDLGRRDFTINSIAYHPQKGIVDPFKGIDDLKKGIIRAVGEAGKRFEEDALRMLRALRFSAQLGFNIDTVTMRSIKNKKALIGSISKERIRNELESILLSRNPSKFILLKETGLLALILPELDKNSFNKNKYILDGVESVKRDRILRWAMLLHEESEDSACSVLKRLKFDNYTIKEVYRLIKYHNININPVPECVKKVVSIIGDELFLKLMMVRKAILNAEIINCSYMSNMLKYSDNDKYYEKEMGKADIIMHIYNSAKEKRECMNIKDLAVNGSDLINIGFEQGKKIGEVLELLLDTVMLIPGMNKREELLKLAAQYL
ncbi:MAG TPA: CCA tRNA nucleotidyltransferase [Clostridiales bacterium]|nr:CCA tRNA nucleotidyltransferase [Clostridiales bacterium]